MEVFKEQHQAMKRLQELKRRYGLKIGTLSSGLGINYNALGSFAHEKSVLRSQDYNRLTAFLDEWDRRMAGFSWSKFRKVEN